MSSGYRVLVIDRRLLSGAKEMGKTDEAGQQNAIGYNDAGNVKCP
jgi:hypothetical protein